MKYVIHIIGSLNTGGAEKVLSDLINYDNNSNHKIFVLGKKYLNEVKFAKNINIKYFNYNILKFYFLILKYDKENIFHFWLQKSIFFSIPLKMFNFKNIIWSIHNNHPYSLQKKFGKLIVKINSLFSKSVPEAIIFCNNIALKNHSNFGNNKNRFIINNPILFNSFRQRNAVNININHIKFLVVANYHECKNFNYLFKIFSNFKIKNFTIDMFGKNIDFNNSKIIADIKYYNLENNVSLNGFQDTNYLYCNYDFSILVSYDESMPLALLEAIASRTLCISTNVGGISEFISKDFLINLDDHIDSYYKIKKIISKCSLNNNYHIYIQTHYNYIKENFDINKIILSYKKLWTASNDT